MRFRDKVQKSAANLSAVEVGDTVTLIRRTHDNSYAQVDVTLTSVGDEGREIFWNEASEGITECQVRALHSKHNVTCASE